MCCCCCPVMGALGTLWGEDGPWGWGGCVLAHPAAGPGCWLGCGGWPSAGDEFCGIDDVKELLTSLDWVESAFTVPGLRAGIAFPKINNNNQNVNLDYLMK